MGIFVSKVVKRKKGWHVLSEEGKNLGGPYKTEGEAKKRLQQVEFFKHKKGSEIKRIVEDIIDVVESF
tara:strand:+ start:604 stop:807 length:204 start_codon:yes stop_codon:yes gene_type:complete